RRSAQPAGGALQWPADHARFLDDVAGGAHQGWPRQGRDAACAAAFAGDLAAAAWSRPVASRWALGDDRRDAHANLRPSLADLAKGRGRGLEFPCQLVPPLAQSVPYPCLNIRNPATTLNSCFAGNNLACGNCHLQAGTKKFGIPLFGLFGVFPRYSARLGAEMTIEERLNACMTRSMNGRALPADAPEMQALVAYIKFLSTGLSPGQLLPGMGTGKMPELDRPADPARGAASYANACVACHGPDGAGIRRSLPTTDLGYMMPPLWGNDSFNDGAGMARLITAANFLHFNMPHGVDFLNPQLSPEQAWDIAAYVISQPRPHKAGLDKDFPDLLEKPVDAPYGPYADGFSEQQHKYGPFAPIRAAIAKLKAEKAGGPTPPP